MECTAFLGTSGWGGGVAPFVPPFRAGVLCVQPFFRTFVSGVRFACKNMQLSVIIPIYNARDTLARCLHSIVQQMPSGMEVLLIDDGSTDGSALLADEWAAAHPQVSVYHKANGGLSDARNAGLRLAQGHYVTFVDADDEVAPDTYAALMALLDADGSTDVLEFPVRVRAGHASEHTLLLPDRQWPSARCYWLNTEAWEHAYAWNKVYRRTLFQRVQFPVGRLFEDIYTTPRLLALGVRVHTTSQGMYVYHWNHQGITATAGGHALAQLLGAQLRAARLMHTRLLSRHGWRLYRSMLYRQVDVYRLTGHMMVRCPLVRLLCRLHELCR